MIGTMIRKVFGTSHERELKRLRPRVERITGLEAKWKSLSDAELRAKTAEFKQKLDNGATLDDILDQRAPLTAGDPLVADLVARAHDLLPSIGPATVTGVGVAVRPIPADGLSSVGSDSGLPGYYEAVTHSGVTLGPLLGRLLAREILTGAVDHLLAPFRPERFRRA